jgi:hypothetical protein
MICLKLSLNFSPGIVPRFRVNGNSIVSGMRQFNVNRKCKTSLQPVLRQLVAGDLRVASELLLHAGLC